jgi:hypothetical protein
MLLRTTGYYWFYSGISKKYILGGLVTLFAAALEINANHFQMTYYLLPAIFV